MDIGGPGGWAVGGGGRLSQGNGEQAGRCSGDGLLWVGQRPLKPLSFQEPGMWHSLEVGSLQIVK